MFDIIKNVITNGGMSLAGIIKKTDYAWANGYITDDEHEYLLELARENANPVDSMAPFMDRLANVEKLVKEVSEKLNEIVNDLNGTEPPIADEYPEYVQPTGAHDAYMTGDKVTYNGVKYECVEDNVVWTPDDYPKGWAKVEDEEPVEE